MFERIKHGWYTNFECLNVILSQWVENVRCFTAFQNFRKLAFKESLSKLFK